MKKLILISLLIMVSSLSYSQVVNRTTFGSSFMSAFGMDEAVEVVEEVSADGEEGAPTAGGAGGGGVKGMINPGINASQRVHRNFTPYRYYGGRR